MIMDAPLLAIYAPSATMLVIAFLAATLPITFFFFLRAWLGSVKEENPEEFEREQAKADREHLAHHGHGGGSHHHHA